MRGGRIVQTWGLTPEALLEQERQAPPRIAERLQAVRLVWQAYPVQDVGRIVGRHPGAVRRYLQAWNQGGPEALALGHAPGARPKRTPEETAAVCAALPQSPRLSGWAPRSMGTARSSKPPWNNRTGFTSRTATSGRGSRRTGSAGRARPTCSSALGRRSRPPFARSWRR